MQVQTAIADLNRLIFERGLEVMTTAVVMTFYKENSDLYFSYAGHPALLLRRGGKRDWGELGIKQGVEPSNLPLGILSGTNYDQGRSPLSSGDRLFLHTDGVTEIMNSEGELFGTARLLDVLERTADAPLSEVKQAVRAAAFSYAESVPQDDLTLIVLEID